VEKCRHCPRRRNAGGRRGLCLVCYRNPKIREQYCRYAQGEREPTETELDALIAQRMQCLPEWWYEEVEAEKNRNYTPRMCELVRRR
jgi:hypothetical protein